MTRLARRSAGYTLVLLATVVVAFPVLWMVLTSLKREGDAYTSPPRIAFHPTLSQFSAVFNGNAGPPFEHSLFVSLVSVGLVLLLGIPWVFAVTHRLVSGEDAPIG